MSMIRAFRHGRLVTVEEARNMTWFWVQEMDRFERTRTEDELRAVRAYVRGLLTKIARERPYVSKPFRRGEA